MNIDSMPVQGTAAGTAIASTTTDYWFDPYWSNFYHILPFAELAQVAAVAVITYGAIKWAKAQAKKYVK